MKIQSKLRLKQGEKRLGEDISGTKGISDTLKSKYYIEYMYQGIEQRENFKTIPENALIKNGIYYVMSKNKISYPLLYLKTNKPVKVDKITGSKKYHKDTKSHNVNIRVISGLKLKYKIFQGYDWKNAKYIYHVVGINNDYVGEWHSLKRDAQKELKYLSKKVVGGIYKSHG